MRKRKVWWFDRGKECRKKGIIRMLQHKWTNVILSFNLFFGRSQASDRVIGHPKSTIFSQLRITVNQPNGVRFLGLFSWFDLICHSHIVWHIPTIFSFSFLRPHAIQMYQMYDVRFVCVLWLSYFDSIKIKLSSSAITSYCPIPPAFSKVRER